MKKTYILTLLALLFAGVVNAQIVQVTDINTTGNAGITGPPTMYNGELFFEADDGLGVIGDELYKLSADGTVTLLKDINTDALDTSPNGDPKNFIEYNGKLYFAGNDGDNGTDKHDTELWVTDGTPDGTMMVEDAWVGGEGNALNPQQMWVFNGKLYFNGKIDAANQVFRYDGTNPIAQITTWRDNGSAVPFFPCVDETNGKTYLKATDGKYQLGVINADETTLFITVNPNADHGFAGIEAGVIYKDKFYFDGDNGVAGDELFVSDGTEAGTMMLKDIQAGDATSDSDPEGFTIYKDELYFMAELGSGMQLWKTDGTEAGTVMVADPNPAGGTDLDFLTLYNDMLYFAASDGTNGKEVWVSDGSTEGTKMLKNLDGDVADSNPEGFKEVDGLLFFAADDAGVNGERLYVSDGTEAGTLPVDSLFAVTALPEDVDYKEFVVNGSKLYFTGDDANGDEIFMIDVTTMKELVGQVTDINATGDAGIAGPPTAFNGELFFEADDGLGVIGDELYKLSADGTVSLLKDINTDALDTSPNGDPKNFIEYNGKLYFAGNDGDNGTDKHDTELWVTDGTPDGTMMVEDAWVGGEGNALNPQQMWVFNGKLYFNGKIDAANQVFRYDGTNPIAQITTWRDNGSAVPFFPCVDETNGKTYLKATDGKYQLGVINADETTLFITVNPNADHGFAGIEAGVIYKDKFYFDGDNGVAGDELFVSDGTEAGTMMLKDIQAGDATSDSDPEGFTIYKDELYFMAELGDGMELWKTDGTEAGTVMVADPNPAGGTDLDFLTLYNDMLYFAASDGTNGLELWTSDGTADGTKMLKNLDGGVGDSKPEGFKEVDGLLFFAADDAPNKEILWVTNGDADYTMTVAEATNSAVAGYDINYKEFAVIGTVLYYTGDDANGDEIFSVDANKIWAEDVTFTVTDENGALEGATVEFDGTTATTDADGVVTFAYVRMGADQAYTVTLEDYEAGAGTVTVADEAVSEAVVLVALPTYDVTFTVTDGTNPIDGASIDFNGATGTTDASGVYTVTELLPAADLAYTITMAGYTDVTGTVTIVDQNVAVNEAMTLILYTVTFNVTDGTNPLEGAVVTFDGADMTTTASGSVVFADVVPGTGLAYSVTLDYRYYDVDATVDVDGDEVVDVPMALTALDQNRVSRMSIYPNPSTGTVYVGGVENDATYEIYNITQQKIAEGILDGKQINLDVEAGLYIIKVASNGETFVNRVIIK